ncbi:PRC-barrel domain-containing protein [Burkholderia sp. 8Y]|uniref:PRC-barrel domain-containing protein n=1 Tax=Burkholderia sp. 8Y TaxID=2653133 RepID=UPI0012F03AC9|nr:PRC-barrel domain-containing protein [Burkholderia sp. 8Y]VXC04959.1 PRC-barrel domain-containing protein [Burkholderia sp. 8Y]
MAGGISHRGDASSVGAAALVPAFSIEHAATRLLALLFAVVARVRALRLSTVLVMLGACSLSACSVFQTPAPIVEHSYIPGPSETESTEPEEPAPVVAAPEPASAAKPAPAPKPKRRVVKPKPPEPVVTPPPEPPEPPPPPQIISTRLMQHDQLHGVLDAEVQRPDGKVVGRAVDLYVDTSSRPKLLMVNLSGFLGIGDRKVNFPWTAFRFTPNSKTAPITFLPPPPPAKGKPAADAVPKPQPINEAPANFVQLVDSTVTQKNGARIGRVVDVLVDSQAQPQALVVDLSSSLAGEKRHVAANWGDLHVVSRNKQLALQMDFNDAQLKAAPTYAPEQPIKIVSPAVPAPASSAAASGGASGGANGAANGAAAAGAGTSGGTTASGSVAAQTPSSGARPAR